jgi:hypothetical protein
MDKVNPLTASELLRLALWALDDGDIDTARQHVRNVGYELAIDGALAQREAFSRDFGPACVSN